MECIGLPEKRSRVLNVLYVQKKKCDDLLQMYILHGGKFSVGISVLSFGINHSG